MFYQNSTLTSIRSAAAVSPPYLARTLSLLSALDMVRARITRSSPSNFLTEGRAEQRRD